MLNIQLFSTFIVLNMLAELPGVGWNYLVCGIPSAISILLVKSHNPFLV